MVNLVNESPQDFCRYTVGKKIYLFGAGRTAKHCIDVYCQNKEVIAIIDNNHSMIGKYVVVEGKKIPIISLGDFAQEATKVGVGNVVLLITTVFYAWQIVEQLDNIQQLAGLHCYLHFLLRNYPVVEDNFVFTQGLEKIPKVIHYFWLGGKEMPKHLQEYVETWKDKCKGFEVICWNEKNYDLSKNRYMREAYKEKAWGFVPDYARLDLIYTYGGIYLDTDVEVLKNINVLLNDDAFFGAGSNDQINLGSGFGAIPKHPLIKQLRDFYEDKSFYRADGSINNLPCYNYQHPVLKGYGFEIKNSYQKKNNVVIYPAEILSPTGIGGLGNFFTDNTISIHHTELSWISEKEKAALEVMKKELSQRVGE